MIGVVQCFQQFPRLSSSDKPPAPPPYPPWWEPGMLRWSGQTQLMGEWWRLQKDPYMGLWQNRLVLVSSSHCDIGCGYIIDKQSIHFPNLEIFWNKNVTYVNLFFIRTDKLTRQSEWVIAYLRLRMRSLVMIWRVSPCWLFFGDRSLAMEAEFPRLSDCDDF